MMLQKQADRPKVDNIPTLVSPYKKNTCLPDSPCLPMISCPCHIYLPDELVKLVYRDAALVSYLSWEEFLFSQKYRGDFAILGEVLHPEGCLL